MLAACRGSRGVLTMPDYADISRNFETLELAANSSGSGGGVDAEHILACLSAMQTRTHPHAPTTTHTHTQLRRSRHLASPRYH